VKREFSPRERVLSAFKGEYADRVPAYPLMGDFSARLLGISAKEWHTNPAKMADSVVRYHEMFTPDSVAIISDLWLEAEAVGNTLEFPDEACPYVKTYVLEQKSALVKLNTPDPRHDKRMPYLLEAFDRMATIMKDTPLTTSVTGPCTIAMCLRRPDRFLTDVFDDPAFVYDLMRFSTDLAIIMSDELQKSGVMPSIADPSASCSVISPSIYRQFVKPYHEEMVQHFKRLTIHICGYIDPIMEDLASVGFNGISIDEMTSFERALQVFRERGIVVIGNMSPRLFVDGTKMDIEQVVSDCIRTAAKGSRFILSSGCEVPAETPLELINYFFEVIRKHGTLDRIMSL